MKKTNWEHQKEATITDQGNRARDERSAEHEKQKLHGNAKSDRQTRAALKKKHSTDHPENR